MAKNKDGSFRTIAIVMIATMIIAFNWDKWTWMKKGIESILNPTFGSMLNWNLTIGMIIIVFLVSGAMTLLQKYTTNQKELKEIKKTQKEIQKKMKEFKDHPEKMMKLQKEQMGLMPKQMKLGMRTIIYTGIPFVLLFRWLHDYFQVIEDSTGVPVRFFGFLGWFMFYLIGSIIFSSILKKKFDVV